jgi:hypothetical protein
VTAIPIRLRKGPNPAARPEPMCAEPLRLRGVSLSCDRPRGHIPAGEHASTIHWHDPVVRVHESHAKPRDDIAVIRENARRYRIEELGIPEDKA